MTTARTDRLTQMKAVVVELAETAKALEALTSMDGEMAGKFDPADPLEWGERYRRLEDCYKVSVERLRTRVEGLAAVGS